MNTTDDEVMPIRRWWVVKKGEVNKVAIEYVSELEQQQFDVYDRFAKLAALYDPNSPWADLGRDPNQPSGNHVSENIVASNVDTVASAIAASEVRARFMTDGAGWAMQRLAKSLEYYTGEICALFDVDAKCKQAFSPGCTVKGTGLVYTDLDRTGDIVCQVVPADDVIVDERECRGGRQPKQLHWRRFRDRDELIAEHPESEEAIRRASKMRLTQYGLRWADYRPLEDNDIVTVTSWRRPVGKKGKKGYQPGRKVTCIDGHDLEDETWEDDCFPFAKAVWTPREDGWYGIGLAERIAGHQRTVNKSNLHIERVLDQSAFVTHFVDMADAKIGQVTVNKVGTWVPIKGNTPKAYMPPAVHPETYQRHERTIAKSFEESGVSRMAAQSVKPAGLDSGRALREYRDQTTQRFALQEEAYERLKLDIVRMLLIACKKMAAKGKKPPTVQHESRVGIRKIPWAKVEPAFLKTTIAASSNINRTPGGREQTLIEWAQAGVISTDDFRRLIEHPDLERAMSLYTAAQDDVDECLDAIADGEVVMPEPFMNLEMCVWRGQQQYLLWNRGAAPEEVLEGVRRFVVQAAAMLDQRNAAPVGPDAMPGAAAAPGSGTPAAALSTQAMQLRAG
jgi:hypothetical protein